MLEDVALKLPTECAFQDNRYKCQCGFEMSVYCSGERHGRSNVEGLQGSISSSERTHYYSCISRSALLERTQRSVSQRKKRFCFAILTVLMMFQEIHCRPEFETYATIGGLRQECEASCSKMFGAFSDIDCALEFSTELAIDRFGTV